MGARRQLLVAQRGILLQQLQHPQVGGVESQDLIRIFHIKQHSGIKIHRPTCVKFYSVF
jgi:hypothetical protein